MFLNILQQWSSETCAQSLMTVAMFSINSAYLHVTMITVNSS